MSTYQTQFYREEEEEEEEEGESAKFTVIENAEQFGCQKNKTKQKNFTELRSFRRVFFEKPFKPSAELPAGDVPWQNRFSWHSFTCLLYKNKGEKTRRGS